MQTEGSISRNMNGTFENANEIFKYYKGKSNAHLIITQKRKEIIKWNKKVMKDLLATKAYFYCST